MSKPGEIVTYFVQGANGGPIKIGKSCRNILVGRVASLQTGNPYPLVVRRAMRGNHESELHWRFRDHRLCGEWFKPALELRKIPRGIVGDASADPIRDAYCAGFRDGVAEGMSTAVDAVDFAAAELKRASAQALKFRPTVEDAAELAEITVRRAFEGYVTSSRRISAHEPPTPEQEAA